MDDMRRQTTSEKVYSTDEAREKIEADTARFLASGGKIQRYSSGASNTANGVTYNLISAAHRGTKASIEARR